MRTRTIHQSNEALVDAKECEIKESKCKLDSQLVESLGFTIPFLNEVSDEFSQFDSNQQMTLAEIAYEMGLCSAKLNLLSTKFNKVLSIERIKLSRQKQIAWAEMVARERSERLTKEINKARANNAKKLTGIDKKMYKKDGKLPNERLNEMMKAFEQFKIVMQGEGK